VEVVSSLLIARAEKNLANRSDETALHLAINGGNLEILRLLLAAGVEIDSVAWDLAMEWPDVKRLFRLAGMAG
jgi:ankyrin repeat protein